VAALPRVFSTTLSAITATCADWKPSGAGFDSINLVSDVKFAKLSALNGMLYEFLPPEDPETDRRIGLFTM